MKIIYTVIIFLLFSNLSNGQYPYGYYNQNNSMNNIGMGLQGILSNNYASSAQQGSMYGQAAEINAYGNYVVNQSIANINNQTAYSMSLNNQVLRARTFFEKRQMNRYYRDLEDYQRKERVRLKASGVYDIDAIESMYRLPN